MSENENKNVSDFDKFGQDNDLVKNTRAVAGMIPLNERILMLDQDVSPESSLNLLGIRKGKHQTLEYSMCTENIARLIEDSSHSLAYLSFDEWTNMFRIRYSGEKTRQMDDHDAIVFQTAISRRYPNFQKVSKMMVYDAMVSVAMAHKYDSAILYMKSLVWDGTDRLKSWLREAYGVEDNDYHRAVGSNWLKGLVKRIIEPGCKFDFVLVLEGEQGTKKSMSLAVLGGDWHVETTMSTDSKDFFMQFRGKSIIEFSEGETLSRTEVKKMKAIITTQIDTYRPAYGRNSMDFPRRCVFAMTTNQEEYLKDETGNRRWFPVKVVHPKANVEWLKGNRDQLFAEAYHRLTVFKENVWEMPEDEVLTEQSKRRIHDPNSELIEDWYWNQITEEHRLEGVTVHESFVDVYHSGFNAGKTMTRYEEMQIANVFKNSLGLVNRQAMVNKVRKSRWFNPKTDIMNEVIENSKVLNQEEINQEKQELSYPQVR